MKKKSKKNKKHISKKYTKSNRSSKLFLPSNYQLDDLSSSYAPSINHELITIKPGNKGKLYDCNINQAYDLKEPLQIGIPGMIYGKTCYDYTSKSAKQYLLKNLSHNKTVDCKKIVPPKQLQSNCWFNTFFVNFFISDKGRKFFHYFRQLMIEGKQHNGKTIPKELQNAFALLNFGVDASLTGNRFAYELNTNQIIKKIYKSIPKKYIRKLHYLVDVDKPGNPLMYYMNITNYLSNDDIDILFMKKTTKKWKSEMYSQIIKRKKMPHVIVMEIYSKDASFYLDKPIKFAINNNEYMIDSAVIKDKSGSHFCSTLTCNKKEMGYDGLSHHSLLSFEWKHKLNSNIDWSYEGSLDLDNKTVYWNFTSCYQMLFFYRVK